MYCLGVEDFVRVGVQVQGTFLEFPGLGFESYGVGFE